MADDDKPAGAEKVVFLAFSNPDMVTNCGLDYRACAACRNKTFVVIHDRDDEFPMMRCACCQTNLGRIGWAE